MDRHTQTQLLERLNRDAACIAAHFGLRYRRVEAERKNVRNRFGSCHDDGTIRIRLRNTRTGLTLRYSSLVDTLCHELAHLRHWNHDRRFRSYHRKLLDFARAQGIYRPARRRVRAAAQQPPTPCSQTARRGGQQAGLADPAGQGARAVAGAARAAAPRQLALFAAEGTPH